jgi:hypothetical protein
MQFDDFMMAVTIFVLFGDDIRILLFPPAVDSGFAFFVNISFVMFIVEMVLYFVAKSDFSKGVFKVKGYAFSFFFWLDLLAVLSMVPDVSWLASGGGNDGSFLDSLGEVCKSTFYSPRLCISEPNICYNCVSRHKSGKGRHNRCKIKSCH